MTTTTLPALRDGTWTVRAHDAIASFTVRELGLIRVRGGFTVTDGSVTVRDGRPVAAAATLDARSVRTGMRQAGRRPARQALLPHRGAPADPGALHRDHARRRRLDGGRRARRGRRRGAARPAGQLPARDRPGQRTDQDHRGPGPDPDPDPRAALAGRPLDRDRGARDPRASRTRRRCGPRGFRHPAPGRRAGRWPPRPPPPRPRRTAPARGRAASPARAPGPPARPRGRGRRPAAPTSGTARPTARPRLAGAIRLRSAWPSSTLSYSGRKRTGAGTSASGRGASGRSCSTRPSAARNARSRGASRSTTSPSRVRPRPVLHVGHAWPARTPRGSAAPARPARRRCRPAGRARTRR